LESVEECGSSLAPEVSGGEIRDDAGEGELDGLGVFKGVKLKVVFAVTATSVGLGGAEVSMALMEALVEEAIAAALERGRLALNTICLDVVAERNLDRHGVLLWWTPRGGIVWE
jgi:hypothetical protein